MFTNSFSNKNFTQLYTTLHNYTALYNTVAILYNIVQQVQYSTLHMSTQLYERLNRNFTKLYKTLQNLYTTLQTNTF